MSCTRHLLNLEWEHHSWRRRVVSAETITAPESTMWGRPVTGASVRCLTQDVCDECGAVRPATYCLCDIERGENCALRRASMGEAVSATPGV